MSSPNVSRPTASGPADRVAFFEEQRRNRRATWRLAVVSALGVALMGIPVSLVVTPLVYGVLLIAIDSANLFHLAPASVARLPAAVAGLLQGVLDWIASEAMAQPPGAATVVLFVTALVAPGVALMVALWLGVRALLHRAGVGGLLLKLGARDPRPLDLEEHQLQNIVQEMAIAAGLAQPRVVLLDTDGANAALIGSAGGEATVVVSRRLLDDFSREETEAVVGHLVGSMSNGDLKIAFTISSVFQTFGLLVTLLDAPFSLRSTDNLRRLMWLLMHRRADDVAERDLAGALLAGRLSFDDDAESPDSNERPGIWTPVILINLTVKWTLFVFTSALVGPAIALLWRARRYLADATAVQLTRNPDALWSALAKLVHRGGLVDGGDAASHLFIVGPESIAPRSLGEHLRRGADDRLGTNSYVAFHPPLDRRLRRLHAQGATLDVAPRRSTATPLPRLVYAIGVVVVGVLLTVGMAAAFAGVALFLFISLFFAAMALMAIHGIFYLLGAVKAAIIGFTTL
jgi:Zn-dependent protease with chaperone function